MKMLVALLGLALAFVSPAARAAEPVDMLLVLAADVSRSVTDPKFRLQREGAAAAITHPDVVRAITSARTGASPCASSNGRRPTCRRSSSTGW